MVVKFWLIFFHKSSKEHVMGTSLKRAKRPLWPETLIKKTPKKLFGDCCALQCIMGNMTV